MKITLITFELFGSDCTPTGKILYLPEEKDHPGLYVLNSEKVNKFLKENKEKETTNCSGRCILLKFERDWYVLSLSSNFYLTEIKKEVGEFESIDNPGFIKYGGLYFQFLGVAT